MRTEIWHQRIAALPGIARFVTRVDSSIREGVSRENPLGLYRPLCGDKGKGESDSRKYPDLAFRQFRVVHHCFAE